MKTVLEHLIFLTGKNIVTVCKELQITPQQFSDWIKRRRPIPSERLNMLVEYFKIDGAHIADDKSYAKKLSSLSSVEIEIMVVSNMKEDAKDCDSEELKYRLEKLEKEKRKQIRIARFAAVLEKDNMGDILRIDTLLDEIETGVRKFDKTECGREDICRTL